MGSCGHVSRLLSRMQRKPVHPAFARMRISNCLLQFQRHNLLNTPSMTSTAKISRQERFKNLFICRQVDKTPRKRNDVCIVMLAAKSSKSRRNNVRSPNSINLVRCNGHTNARAANKNASLSYAIDNIVGHKLSVVGIIDSIVVFRAAIEYFMTLLT